MEEKLLVAKQQLEKYGQEHLLQCYENLSKDEQNKLLDEILTMDFKQVNDLYESTKTKVDFNNVKLEPIAHTTKSELSKEEFADELAHSLEKRINLLKLISVNMYEMEENSSIECVTEFKIAYGKSIEIVKKCLIKFFKEMNDKEIEKFIYTFFPFMIGIYPYAVVTDKKREAMKNAMTPMLEEMEKKEPSLFSKATSIANGILSRLRKAFDEHSPSKETRKIFKYLMQGAELGLDDERKNLNAEAEKIAKETLNNLKMSNLGINSGLKNGIIDSTKTIFTTPQIIFNVQELDEAKLQQCFNYVNRKFGSAY